MSIQNLDNKKSSIDFSSIDALLIKAKKSSSGTVDSTATPKNEMMKTLENNLKLYKAASGMSIYGGNANLVGADVGRQVSFAPDALMQAYNEI